jgi:hypothetical protein
MEQLISIYVTLACRGCGAGSISESQPQLLIDLVPDRVQSRLMRRHDRLNPLAPPGRRLEGIREILGLVHDLAIAELHNAHCVCW